MKRGLLARSVLVGVIIGLGAIFAPAAPQQQVLVSCAFSGDLAARLEAGGLQVQFRVLDISQARVAFLETTPLRSRQAAGPEGLTVRRTLLLPPGDHLVEWTVFDPSQDRYEVLASELRVPKRTDASPLTVAFQLNALPRTGFAGARKRLLYEPDGGRDPFHDHMLWNRVANWSHRDPLSQGILYADLKARTVTIRESPFARAKYAEFGQRPYRPRHGGDAGVLPMVWADRVFAMLVQLDNINQAVTRGDFRTAAKQAGYIERDFRFLRVAQLFPGEYDRKAFSREFGRLTPADQRAEVERLTAQINRELNTVFLQPAARPDNPVAAVSPGQPGPAQRMSQLRHAIRQIL